MLTKSDIESVYNSYHGLPEGTVKYQDITSVERDYISVLALYFLQVSKNDVTNAFRNYHDDNTLEYYHIPKNLEKLFIKLAILNL